MPRKKPPNPDARVHSLRLPVSDRELSVLHTAAARSTGRSHSTATWARDILLGVAGRADQLVLERILQKSGHARQLLNELRSQFREPEECPECGVPQYFTETLCCFACGYSGLARLHKEGPR